MSDQTEFLAAQTLAYQRRVKNMDTGDVAKLILTIAETPLMQLLKTFTERQLGEGDDPSPKIGATILWEIFSEGYVPGAGFWSLTRRWPAIENRAEGLYHIAMFFSIAITISAMNSQTTKELQAVGEIFLGEGWFQAVQAAMISKLLFVRILEVSYNGQLPTPPHGLCINPHCQTDHGKHAVIHIEARKLACCKTCEGYYCTHPKCVEMARFVGTATTFHAWGSEIALEHETFRRTDDQGHIVNRVGGNVPQLDD